MLDLSLTRQLSNMFILLFGIAVFFVLALSNTPYMHYRKIFRYGFLFLTVERAIRLQRSHYRPITMLKTFLFACCGFHI